MLVVSDGVSVSPNPHLASAAAVDAAAATPGGRPFAGPDDLVAAVSPTRTRPPAAVPSDSDPSLDPRTAATPPARSSSPWPRRPRSHVANVGDARGYLLRPDPTAPGGGRSSSSPPTTAWRPRAVAEGVDPDVALNLPGGPRHHRLAGGRRPRAGAARAAVPVAAGDLVLVCSDGLWNYAPTDAGSRRMVTGRLPPPGRGDPALAAAVCEAPGDWADEAGGADNICVALAPVADHGGDPGRRPSESGGADV